MIIKIMIILSFLARGMNILFNNGDLLKDYEDAFLDTGELIVKYGYTVQEHLVQTEDGYLLKMFRIPSSSYIKNRPVYIQHGLLCSSADFVILGPHKSIVYLLADAGYDIWLGNARGNTYSRNHTWLNANGKKFWQFSWHEIGVHDLPAMIDYILHKTSSEKLYYIGHSQGTTAFYVMASELPEYNKKIQLMINLSPVAFMSHIKSPFLRLVAPMSLLFKDALSLLGGFELNPKSKFYTHIIMRTCKEEAVTQALCQNLLFIICGFDSDQFNNTALPIILNHTPSGASSMQCLHYGQLIVSGKFRHYDFGIKNLLKYRQFSPPDYKLHLVTAPIVLMYGVNDWLSDIKDVQKLEDILPNVVLKYKVPHPHFNHLDFLYAKDIKTLVNDKILELLSQY